MKKEQKVKKFEIDKRTILKFEKMKIVNGGTGINDNCQDINKSMARTEANVKNN